MLLRGSNFLCHSREALLRGSILPRHCEEMRSIDVAIQEKNDKKHYEIYYFPGLPRSFQSLAMTFVASMQQYLPAKAGMTSKIRVTRQRHTDVAMTIPIHHY